VTDSRGREGLPDPDQSHDHRVVLPPSIKRSEHSSSQTWRSKLTLVVSSKFSSDVSGSRPAGRRPERGRARLQPGRLVSLHQFLGRSWRCQGTARVSPGAAPSSMQARRPAADRSPAGSGGEVLRRGVEAGREYLALYRDGALVGLGCPLEHGRRAGHWRPPPRPSRGAPACTSSRGSSRVGSAGPLPSTAVSGLEHQDRGLKAVRTSFVAVIERLARSDARTMTLRRRRESITRAGCRSLCRRSLGLPAAPGRGRQAYAP
jgi:hypothetical protein